MTAELGERVNAATPPSPTTSAVASDSSLARVLLPIAAAVFVAMLGVGMLVPNLPILAKQTTGDAVAAGGLMSAFGLARLIFNVPAGLLADRIGIRPTMVIGLCVLAIGSFIPVVIAGYPAVVAMILLQGVGGAVFVTAAITALVERAGPARRGSAMAWYQGAFLLALSAGPVVGGFLGQHFGYRTVFLCQSVISVCTLLVVRGVQSAAVKPSRRGLDLGLLRNYRLLAACLMCFAGFFGRSASAWTLIPVVATKWLGLDPTELGVLIGVGTAANFLTLPVVGRMIDRWGAHRALLVTTAVTVGALLLLAAATPWSLWLGTVLVMTGTGAMLPAASALALAVGGKAGTGAITGLVRSAGDLGLTLGPVGAVGMARAAGLTAADGFWLTALVVGVLAGFFVITESRRQPSPRST